MSGKWRNFLTRTSWNHCTEPTSSRAVRMAAARWQRGWRKLTGDMVDCKSGVCDDWPNKFVWRWRCCCAALHVSSFPLLDRMVVGDKSKVFCFWFATLSLLFFLFSFFFLLFFHPDVLPRFVFISVSFRPPPFPPIVTASSRLLQPYRDLTAVRMSSWLSARQSKFQSSSTLLSFPFAPVILTVVAALHIHSQN